MKASDDVYAVSAFTHELVADVKTGGYGLRAWQVFLARSWARSIDDIRASPGRARSLLRWSGVGAVIGAALLEVVGPRKTLAQAAKAGLGAGLGLLASTIGRVVIACSMLSLFLLDCFIF